MPNATGYLSPLYAQSLAEFGRPLELPNSRGWLLVRSIPNTPYEDAMGCYPLFACQNEAALQQDLEALDSTFVAVGLVIDPFIKLTPKQLMNCFPDYLIPFKDHYILDMDGHPERVARKRALRYARTALKTLTFEVCPCPMSQLDEWMRLYGCLIQRHNLRGLHTFSRDVFAAQMKVPGFVLAKVSLQGLSIGMLSWYLHRDTAYAHLIGVDDDGYRLRAAYALYWGSIQYFTGKVKQLNLGGVPGYGNTENQGLAQFKNGWASHTKKAYFGGRILRRDIYKKLARKSNIKNSQYFPVYRSQL